MLFIEVVDEVISEVDDEVGDRVEDDVVAVEVINIISIQ